MSTIQQHKNSLLRIGAIAKSTGIPVTTLRIWETRYSAFKPFKSSGNQRLYSENDVAKAMLLKHLSNNGHTISLIAALELDELRKLNNLMHETQKVERFATQPISIAIVGMSMANRIESTQFIKNLTQNEIKVTDVLQDLEAASQHDFLSKPQVLIIKLNSLHSEAHREIVSLVRKHKFPQTIVTYNFAPDVIIQAMKMSGLIVRREPITNDELAELLQSVFFINHERAKEFGTSGAVISSRKYSDETLTRVSGISTNVLCECPRHVAELIYQLSSFEEYSLECLNKNTDDAHLHAFLHSISGSARTLFENALEKIAQHENINLND
jgi:DNA-binding transcriptional MerR regulator